MSSRKELSQYCKRNRRTMRNGISRPERGEENDYNKIAVNNPRLRRMESSFNERRDAGTAKLGRAPGVVVLFGTKRRSRAR